MQELRYRQFGCPKPSGSRNFRTSTQFGHGLVNLVAYQNLGSQVREPFKHMAMGQNPNRTPRKHPNPTTKIGDLKWVVNSPTNQNGIPLVLTHIFKNWIRPDITQHEFPQTPKRHPKREAGSVTLAGVVRYAQLHLLDLYR